MCIEFERWKCICAWELRDDKCVFDAKCNIDTSNPLVFVYTVQSPDSICTFYVVFILNIAWWWWVTNTRLLKNETNFFQIQKNSFLPSETHFTNVSMLLLIWTHVFLGLIARFSNTYVHFAQRRTANGNNNADRSDNAHAHI